MAKLSTKKASQTHRCIIYGGPKTGKSLIAGELAEYYNLIWVDMENGHDVLFKLPQKLQDKVELIELKDTRSYPIAIETVLKMVKGPVSICEDHGKVSCMLCRRKYTDDVSKPGHQKSDIKNYAFIDVDLNSLDNNTVVVFDSLTQLTDSCIAHITKDEPDDYKLQRDDWGNLGKLLNIFLSHIQQSNYNVIVISHEAEIETEGRKNKLMPVGGTKNFSRNVAKFFDHVIYAEVKNKRHVFASSTTYATNILTGSRTDVAMEDADRDEEATLLRIFKPELYKDSPIKKQPTKTGGAQASSILARLKAKHK